MLYETIALGVAGLAGGLVHTSVVESLCHNYIQHAPNSARSHYEKHPTISAPLLDAWKSHTIMHHVMTYRAGQTTQHRSLESELNVALYSLEQGFDIGEKYGRTVNWPGFLKMLVPFALGCGLAFYFLPASFALPFSSTALACPTHSRYVHPYLHEDYEWACREAPFVTRQYLKTRLGRFLWVYHDMHHRKPSINFNLFGFVGDWLTGRLKWPSKTDWDKARRVGGPKL